MSDGDHSNTLPNSPPLLLQFSTAMFRETLQTPAASEQERTGGRPQGLMGREVANCSFLTALLTHGHHDQLGFLLDSQRDRDAAVQICRQHLDKRPRACQVQFRASSELSGWLRSPGPRVLHCPQPPAASLAWSRTAGPPHRMAISGVTHTLASPQAVAALRDLVTAPFASYDRLFCTSRSVLRTVRAVTSAWCDYLSQRCGKRPELSPQLELLPLGVDTQFHRLGSATERSEARRRLGIGHDDRVVLFVGRLSHHAKSQPFPMLRAAEHAARDLSHRVQLLFCGWFANDAVRQAFQRGAAELAPSVRTQFVNGLDPFWRDHVWHAADVFVSLSDSVQETFGLTVVEAQSRGLPVVISDWNGYRDLVRPDETAHLIPTVMLRDSLSTQAERLVTQEINYDRFLAEIGQAVAVDWRAAAKALSSLLADPQRSASMGAAARRHAEENFSWPRVLARYEQVWTQQRRELSYASRRKRFVGFGQADGTEVAPRSENTSLGPPRAALDDLYPPVETAFADYPTGWLHAQSRLRASDDAITALPRLLALPLVHHVGESRVTDEKLLTSILAEATELASVAHLTERLVRSGVDAARAGMTLAWLIKYALLLPVEWPERDCSSPAWGKSVAARSERLSLVTTCMGRLSHLKQSLPLMLAQENVEVVVADYSCPEGTAAWVREHHPETTVVEVRDRQCFDRSEAKNSAAFAATSDWLCLVDADVLLDARFADRIRDLLRPGCFYRCDREGVQGTGGTMVIPRAAFEQVGGHDPVFMDWGEEDDDLVDALHFIGLQQRTYPSKWIQHIEHDDALRTRHHEEAVRGVSHMVNRVYRAAKWDLARLTGSVMELAARRDLYTSIRRQIRDALAAGKGTEIHILPHRMHWVPITGTACSRELIYRVKVEGTSEPGIEL